MLSSIALHAGELLAAGLLAGVVFVALVAAGGLWLRRRVRRRLQALGPVLAGRARGAAAAVVSDPFECLLRGGDGREFHGSFLPGNGEHGGAFTAGK